MATASCAPGLRPELGATAGGITVVRCLSLSSGAPRRSPASREGRGPEPQPRGLAAPLRTARLLPKLNRGTALVAWRGAPRLQSCAQQHTWGESEAPAEAGAGMGAVWWGRGDLLGAERGAAAWEFPPGLCFEMGTPT